MQRASAYHTMPSKHDTSTQFRLTAGPPSPALAINHSTLDSAFCWRWCVHRIQADTDPMLVKCWASVADAGQYPFSPSQYSNYQHGALNQNWVNVGPPFVTLAHIQRGGKHSTVTQLVNVGSASRV